MIASYAFIASRGGAGVPQPFAVVFAAGHRGHPVRVLEIPAHGQTQAGLERVPGFETDLAPDLRGVDGVAPIVARAVFHECPEVGVGPQSPVPQRPIRSSRTLGFDGRAQRVHDLEIRALRIPAHVVLLARPPSAEHRQYGIAMIGDVEPVADVAAVAVNGQAPPLDGVHDHERNELLGKLIGPIVVGAVGDDRGQAVSRVPGAHQMVGGGLGRRVGRVRSVGCVLAKGPGVPEGPKDLVGGNMQEPERLEVFGREAREQRSRRLQEFEGSVHVRAHEVAGAVDGTIHMTLGREVHHGLGTVFGKQGPHRVAVGDVSAHEQHTIVAEGALEVLEVTGIGQGVEDHQSVRGRGERLAHEIRPDESGPARDDPRAQVPVPEFDSKGEPRQKAKAGALVRGDILDRSLAAPGSARRPP